MTNNKVAILLATYNGAHYLREQLDSLFNQTLTEWTLYIHDDGSQDDTISIIHKYAKRHDNIKLLNYPSTGGAKDNFLSMLQNVEADYYFFCDQDDVWAEDKVEAELIKMKAEERQYPSMPLVIYSDLYIVDETLHITHDSFFKYEGIYPEFLTTFNSLAASNICPGCTMLINKQARSSTIFPANKATMHDAWINLCTMRAGGKLIGIQRPLVYYRQHGDNTLGARNADELTIAYRIKHFKSLTQLNKEYYAMLKALNYGSIIKYIFFKLVYKIRIRVQK